jgi:hypothetical protein
MFYIVKNQDVTVYIIINFVLIYGETYYLLYVVEYAIIANVLFAI